jgi:hypothetical protein
VKVQVSLAELEDVMEEINYVVIRRIWRDNTGEKSNGN